MHGTIPRYLPTNRPLMAFFTLLTFLKALMTRVFTQKFFRQEVWLSLLLRTIVRIREYGKALILVNPVMEEIFANRAPSLHNTLNITG